MQYERKILSHQDQPNDQGQGQPSLRRIARHRSLLAYSSWLKRSSQSRLPLLYGLVNGVKIGTVPHKKNRNTRAFPMSLISYQRKTTSITSLGPFPGDGLCKSSIFCLENWQDSGRKIYYFITCIGAVEWDLICSIHRERGITNSISNYRLKVLISIVPG